MTDTLTLPPSEIGYSVVFGSGVVATEVEGGPARYMADRMRPSHRVQLQWATNRAGYDYLSNFYDANVGRSFNIDLIIDESGLSTYKAFFEPQGFRLTRVTGGTYEIQGRLEVEFSGQTAFQNELADLRSIYGTDLPGLLLDFHELIVELSTV